MTKTISVSNHKGGAAKTTTAVNLAAGLARKGFSVLLVDLDPQANATFGLGIDTDDEQIQTITHVLGSERLPIQNVLVKTLEPNLMLAPSDIRLTGTEMMLATRPFREFALKKALGHVSEFDYIILDCPPSLNTLTINALVCADRILIPTELTGHALKGLKDLLDAMESVKGDEEYDWRVLLTKISGYGEERQTTASRILAPLAERILRTKIRNTEAIARSQIESDAEEAPSPVVLSKVWNVGARDYRALVKEVIEIWPA